MTAEARVAGPGRPRPARRVEYEPVPTICDACGTDLTRSNCPENCPNRTPEETR